MSNLLEKLREWQRTGDRIIKARINGWLYKPPRFAVINKKRITDCRTCRYAVIKPNVWSKNYPTLQCSEKDLKFNYNPTKVPRWCPHLWN